MSALHISFEDFLEDVKFGIKRKFGSQEAFARSIPVHRNVIVRVTNCVDRLTPYWINLFVETFNLDLRDYMSPKRPDT